MSVVMVDMDGVVAEFTRGFRELANAMFGAPVWGNAEQLTWDSVNRDDLTPDQSRALWAHIKDDGNGFWYSLEPLATADELDRLDSTTSQHDVYYATKRVGRGAKEQTEDWLKKHGIYHPTVVVVRGDKGPLARSIGADWAIDDKPENLMSIKADRPNCQVVLRRWMYNSDSGVESAWGAPVVDSLTQFLDMVEDV